MAALATLVAAMEESLRCCVFQYVDGSKEEDNSSRWERRESSPVVMGILVKRLEGASGCSDQP